LIPAIWREVFLTGPALLPVSTGRVGEEGRSIIVSNYGLRVGHATHRGMAREVNEDGYLVLTPPAVAAGLTGLLAVADGMGGHQAGDKASGEVIRILHDLFSSSSYQEQMVGYSREREDYYILVLKEVLEQINDRLYNLATSHPELQGMGTTGSVALLVDHRLYLGHVGDSRIYLLRGGHLQQLTHDHSWVAEQVEMGVLTPEQAAVHPKRNLLTRCLGHSPVLRVERTALELQPGDFLLLCSDGLHGVVRDAEIAQVLMTAPGLQTACDYLVEMANQRGGPDNITVIVAQVVTGEGSNLPGGRAFGPHDEQLLSQQADTVRLARPRQRARRQAPARQRPARRAGRVVTRPLLALILGAALSLICGLLGARLLSWEKVSERPTIEFLVVFLATLVGLMAGLILSHLLLQKATEIQNRSPDRKG